MGGMTTTLRIRRNGRVEDLPPRLPGAELVGDGIAALSEGSEPLSAAGFAWRAAIAGHRPGHSQGADRIAEPNLALYAAVQQAGGDHFDYNALLGRLSSFADAAESMLGRQARKTA